MAGGARVCLGQIGAAHGVRGEVRLRSFTADPLAIVNYGPLETEDGRVVEIETLRPAKDEPDEFYYADLVGLAVVDRSGQPLGTVVAVHNFGAGDLIELRRAEGKPTQLLPFDEATVPEVDLAAGRLVVELPAGRQ